MLDALHEGIILEHFPAGAALCGLVLPYVLLEHVLALVQHRVARLGRSSHGLRSLLLVHLTGVLGRLGGPRRLLLLRRLLLHVVLTLLLLALEAVPVNLGRLTVLLLLVLLTVHP